MSKKKKWGGKRPGAGRPERDRKAAFKIELLRIMAKYKVGTIAASDNDDGSPSDELMLCGDDGGGEKWLFGLSELPEAK